MTIRGKNVELVCTLHFCSNQQFKYHSTESIPAGRPITLVRQGTPPSLEGVELAKLDSVAVQSPEHSPQKSPPLNDISSTAARYSMNSL